MTNNITDDNNGSQWDLEWPPKRKDILAYHEEKTYDEWVKSEKNKAQKKQLNQSHSKPKLKKIKKTLGPIQSQPLRRLFK